MGLGTTLYLSISHYRVYMDMGYKSFCAISRSINCDTVSQSAYAVLLGMPLAVWGCVGYLFILALLSIACSAKARPRRIWATIQVVAFLFCVFDLYLAWISSYHIKSYCLMCLLTYAVNFALFYFAWLIRRRFNQDSLLGCLKLDLAQYRRYATQVALTCAAVAGILCAGAQYFPPYWQYSLSSGEVTLATGRTAEGWPWIGAQSPELVIEEYSDYLCFQCAKMHAYLRALVSRYPNKIRLVHHQFPMDSAFNPLVKESFHEGAGQMALIALYAETQDKFWQMNDLLFESGRKREPVGLRALGKALDLDYKVLARSIHSSGILKRLRQDIRSGLEHQIVATPSFVINGEVYQGVIPAHILQAVFE
jgi:uncharacterized membrane protein/predicted DsbA family dithiol-disulfide isomerase